MTFLIENYVNQYYRLIPKDLRKTAKSAQPHHWRRRQGPDSI